MEMMIGTLYNHLKGTLVEKRQRKRRRQSDDQPALGVTVDDIVQEDSIDVASVDSDSEVVAQRVRLE